MNPLTVKPIGKIEVNEDGFFLKLKPAFTPALQALDGFSHINVLWWFDGCDNTESRNVLEVPQPYQRAPAVMGTFATRSPQRPNPVALTAAQLIRIDHEAGIIHLAYIDAADGSPVLDIKPYTPSFDRVETPGVPSWCRHWPKSQEESSAFDWEKEFNF